MTTPHESAVKALEKIAGAGPVWELTREHLISIAEEALALREAAAEAYEDAAKIVSGPKTGYLTRLLNLKAAALRGTKDKS